MEALVAATELAPFEEHVGKAVYWPPWLRELALKDWLDLPERFKLTVHLLRNVAPPFVVAKHVAPRLRDSNACAHVIDILEKIRDDKFTDAGKLIQYWDIQEKTEKPLAFAKVDDLVCWDPALALLRSRGRALDAAS